MTHSTPADLVKELRDKEMRGWHDMRLREAAAAALEAMPGGAEELVALSEAINRAKEYLNKPIAMDAAELMGLLGAITRNANALSRLTPSGAIGAEGWRVVPIKPTPEMLQAAYVEMGYPTDGGLTSEAYAAMLAAAPTPPFSSSNTTQKEN